MSKPIEIPHYIDDPLHFLMWQVDEVMPIGVGLVLGVLTEQVFTFLLIGFLSVGLYKKFRDGRPDGIILHYLYWIGLMSNKSHSIPESHKRRFLP